MSFTKLAWAVSVVLVFVAMGGPLVTPEADKASAIHEQESADSRDSEPPPALDGDAADLPVVRQLRAALAWLERTLWKPVTSLAKPLALAALLFALLLAERTLRLLLRQSAVRRLLTLLTTMPIGKSLVQRVLLTLCPEVKSLARDAIAMHVEVDGRTRQLPFRTEFSYEVFASDDAPIMPGRTVSEAGQAPGIFDLAPRDVDSLRRRYFFLRHHLSMVRQYWQAPETIQIQFVLGRAINGLHESLCDSSVIFRDVVDLDEECPLAASLREFRLAMDARVDRAENAAYRPQRPHDLECEPPRHPLVPGRSEVDARTDSEILYDALGLGCTIEGERLPLVAVRNVLRGERQCIEYVFAVPDELRRMMNGFRGVRHEITAVTPVRRRPDGVPLVLNWPSQACREGLRRDVLIHASFEQLSGLGEGDLTVSPHFHSAGGSAAVSCVGGSKTFSLMQGRDHNWIMPGVLWIMWHKAPEYPGRSRAVSPLSPLPDLTPGALDPMISMSPVPGAALPF